MKIYLAQSNKEGNLKHLISHCLNQPYLEQPVNPACIHIGSWTTDDRVEIQKPYLTV